VLDIVVIAASMGGPEAVHRLVMDLPAESPAAIVVVQHRTAGDNQLIVDLLRRRARLPVGLAEHRGQPHPGRIDVAPANGPPQSLTNLDHPLRG
jgi:two-component system chemotaxis response regulator CheB